MTGVKPRFSHPGFPGGWTLHSGTDTSALELEASRAMEQCPAPGVGVLPGQAGPRARQRQPCCLPRFRSLIL